MSSEMSMDSRVGLAGETRRFKTRKLIAVLMVAGVLIGIGFIIGWFSRVPSKSADECDGPCLGPDVPEKIIEDADEGITQKILDAIDGTHIRNYLEKYTSYPHTGGTEGEEQLALELMAEWRRQGLDHVARVQYNVLLSYPNKDDPNVVYLLDNDTIIHKTQLEEKILSEDQNHTDVIPPFNAYSPPGDVEGDLVYVNYGRIEDFQYLTNNLSIDLNGTIVIARYGKIFRGDKVANAEAFGAKAVILYTDPADYSVDDSVKVYPESWWLPGTGVQRGTIESAGIGDPLTPGYPSTNTAYRLPEEKADLPQIPCHPIGYDDARHFLEHLGGVEVPESWKGRLPNITYKFGPGFGNETVDWKVKMHVTTRNQLVNTSNVFAYIRGSVEPDRYVLLGNHRDAWVFGAIDPTSGTALMMEVSRVLSDLVRKGWRPRRTIVFCSWGAEEYGLIGSYEWVQEFVKNLASRAVVYLNVDLSVEGQDAMRAKGVPIVYNLLYDVAKKIPSANREDETMFDEWLRYFPSEKDSKLPRIRDLGSASDFAAFIGVAGVPCIDFRYTHNYTIIDYPLYHSVYETFHLFDSFYDPKYKYSVAVGRFWGEAARYMADSLILPLDALQYAKTLGVFVEDLEEGYGSKMEAEEILLDGLKKATATFQTEAEKFGDRIKTANRKNPLETRMINDQLMQLERAFIDSEGLPGRPFHKHVLFAPSVFDSYAGTTFPGLVDLMWEIEKRVGDDHNNQWEKVRQHLASIIYCVNSATSVIQPVITFN